MMFKYDSFIVDGNWSKYGPYEECSKTCGAGTQSRSRICNNPAPSHGGQTCIGDAKQTRDCVLKECPGK